VEYDNEHWVFQLVELVAVLQSLKNKNLEMIIGKKNSNQHTSY
jgi:hypothetical protein